MRKYLGLFVFVLIILFLVRFISLFPFIVFIPGKPVSTSKPLDFSKFINSLPLEEGSKTGWKKYVNTKQGYSIEFPATYMNSISVANQVKLCDKEIIFSTGTTKNNLCFTIGGPISTDAPVVSKSLREYIITGQKQDSGISSDIVWTKINGEESAVEGGARYYFFNNGHIYTVDKIIAKEGSEKEFQEILSTFKFTN